MQEFVVVGFTEPAGSRSFIGALPLGTRKDGELVHAGRGGTGFSQRSLRELHEKLEPLKARSRSIPGAPPPTTSSTRTCSSSIWIPIRIWRLRR